MRNDTIKGHLLASFTVLVWGMTFVSSKYLLEYLEPLTIMILRFAVGTLVLLILSPRIMKLKERKHELLFLGAGFFGVAFYFLMENIALTYTYASNVSVIVCLAPILTAIACRIFLKEKLSSNFLIGFGVALLGICLISFNGAELKLNPLGDLLAVLAAAAWAMYNVFMRKIGKWEYPLIPTTRRIFYYGLFFLVICIPFLGFQIPKTAAANPYLWGNILFLGILASAICYLTWNTCLKKIGVMATSVYIYVQPVISIIGASVLLGERFTPMAAVGTGLTLTGLIISEVDPKRYGKKEKDVSEKDQQKE